MSKLPPPVMRAVRPAPKPQLPQPPPPAVRTLSAGGTKKLCPKCARQLVRKVQYVMASRNYANVYACIPACGYKE